MTAPANAAAWFGGAVLPVVGLPQTEVHIDGGPEPRVRLDRLETEMGAAPRAWFSAGLGRGPASGEDLRLERMAPRIRPGALVSARLLRGGVLPGASRQDLVLFEGRITEIEMSLNPDGEALLFGAEDLAGDLLRRRIGGQRARTAEGNAALLDGMRLVFNPDGRPNASSDPYDPGSGDTYTIFAAAPGDAAWTLDEAVAYLLAEYGVSDLIDVPTPGEVRAALGSLVIRDVSLEGRTLGEALDALLELASGRTIVSVEPQAEGVSRRLELWTPARAPSGWFAHQGVGDRFDPSRTHFASLAAAAHFASAPRRYVACGDLKIYESSFDLVPGWDDAFATYDPDDFSPSLSADFNARRDVFRKWVLNETGQYSESPYDRGPAPDLAAVFEGAPYVRRRRRLLECLSRDALGRSLGIYAEVSLDGGSTWERLSLGVRVLPGECGLYVTDDPLPPRYLAAAMRGQVCVRVTAAIESDSCLRAERVAPGTDGLPGRTRRLSVPAGYRFRRVAPTSRFHGQAGADEADDSPRLQELVDAAYEADRRSPAPARIEVPFLAMGYRVGTRVLGVRGRRLDLAHGGPAYESAPVVRRTVHRFAPEPRTELELE